MFKRGDRVEILKEFQDSGDEELTWAVQGEEKGKVDILPVDISMNIKPLYTVQVGWIKLAKI